jgi:arsenate reductase
MVNTVFYIKTCDTSRKIIKDFGLIHGFNLREVKSKQITEGELEELAQMAGSFEALFSRRSRAFTQKNLKGQKLTESQHKDFILQ